MRESILLNMMFEKDRLERAVLIASDKEINQKDIDDFCNPDYLRKLATVILSDEYNIFPPSIAKIPKDKPNEYREVYINQPRDRILLILINDVLNELFSDMIHLQCKSYQKGIGTQEVVQRISKEIVAMDKSGIKQIGYKSDFSKYFDTVTIDVIDGIFDEWEDRLNYERNTEPVINLIRRYYHQDIYFDSNGNVCHKYQSLKQGCSISGLLANVCLYELDEYMSNKYKIYYRYSDDIVVIDKDSSHMIEDINKIIAKYGMTLNPKKVEPLYTDKWFKFLGFNLNGNKITLSKNRLKKFQHEVEKVTIKKGKMKASKARKNIIYKLFYGKQSWADGCLGILNVEADLNEMNKFILDCIRACQTGKTKIGGLGSDMTLKDKTVLRGKGRDVRSNKNKTEKIVNDFFSLSCLAKNYKYNKSIYRACVKGMLA